MSDRDRINKAIIAYYGMEDAIMSDEEFDILFIKEYGDEVSPFEVYQNIYELPPPVLTSVSLEVGVSRISKRPATHSQGFLLLYLILPVHTNH